ncbi:MAG TPA: hypothetical protein VMW62_06050 [Chloroflexota bacterium]|nr:hypothetical protein [Chloroflexota bacterium]
MRGNQIHRGQGTYHHSLLFVMHGQVEEARETDWQPEYGGHDRARWVDAKELREANVHANHWPALSQAGLVA